MKWAILYTSSAARSIRQLDPRIRRRVKTAIETLTVEPERGKPLQLTLKGLRSWRTGDYRIVYRITGDRIEILIIVLGHRRDIFDRLRGKL